MSTSARQSECPSSLVMSKCCFRTSIMRGDRRTTSISSSLPSLYPSVVAKRILEGTIRSKCVEIIKPTSSFCYNIRSSRPPFHASGCGAYTCCSLTVKFPNTDERRNWLLRQIKCPPNPRGRLYCDS